MDAGEVTGDLLRGPALPQLFVDESEQVDVGPELLFLRATSAQDGLVVGPPTSAARPGPQGRTAPAPYPVSMGDRLNRRATASEGVTDGTRGVLERKAVIWVNITGPARVLETPYRHAGPVGLWYTLRPLTPRHPLTTVSPGIAVGDAEAALGRLEQLVLLELLVLLVRPRFLDQLPGGVDEERAEDVEDPREVGDDRGARGDEDRAQDQGYEDSDEEHPLLVLRGHGELGHDQDEDEEVVDAQRLLGDEAREELSGGLTAREEEQAESEQPGEGDPDDRPDSGFLDRYVVRLSTDEEVDRDECGKPHDGQDPQGQGNIHCASGST